MNSLRVYIHLFCTVWERSIFSFWTNPLKNKDFANSISKCRRKVYPPVFLKVFDRMLWCKKIRWLVVWTERTSEEFCSAEKINFFYIVFIVIFVDKEHLSCSYNWGVSHCWTWKFSVYYKLHCNGHFHIFMIKTFLQVFPYDRFPSSEIFRSRI